MAEPEPLVFDVSYQKMLGELQNGHLVNSEAWSNGVWNGILSRWFPSPHYVIVPEYNWVLPSGEAGRADLMVFEVAKDMRCVLAFEGKRTGGALFTVNDALNQAKKAAQSVGGDPPCMAALGQNVTISAGNGDPYPPTVGTNGGGVTIEHAYKTIFYVLDKISTSDLSLMK